VFGSHARGDAKPDSDLDVLITFPPGLTPSLLQLGGMQVELTRLLGCVVDLKTPGFLSSRVRAEVRSEAVTHYAA
jgi:predicted nucleotidyltransferase